MPDKKATLNERQKMLTKHLLSKLIDSPSSAAEILKDPKSHLSKLGATDADVQAIGRFTDQLQAQLKEQGRVGWW